MNINTHTHALKTHFIKVFKLSQRFCYLIKTDMHISAPTQTNNKHQPGKSSDAVCTPLCQRYRQKLAHGNMSLRFCLFCLCCDSVSCFLYPVISPSVFSSQLTNTTFITPSPRLICWINQLRIRDKTGSMEL